MHGSCLQTMTCERNIGIILRREEASLLYVEASKNCKGPIKVRAFEKATVFSVEAWQERSQMKGYRYK
jgi:hypothetical protein